jgi:hypothetical protein
MLPETYLVHALVQIFVHRKLVENNLAIGLRRVKGSAEGWSTVQA